ncbi:helix-turn-helix transcriptional regulator [Natrinema salinisoli]|uniref:helix-turn-helix transcriptional regulator n=1 Tax=Natrinema salinisoli TaxID=2878535 RepID=UPI001CF07E3B|nr:hypothetical protein [Natrinema salinisoli]
MRMSTAATLALAVLLATTTMGAVAATPSASTPATIERPAPDPSSLSTAPEQSQSVSASSTAPPPLERPDTWQVIRIRITDTGDAKWTVESRFRVTDDDDAETFDEYADAVVSGQRDAGYDPQLFERYANLASKSTGRNMSIENAAWDDPRIETVDLDADRSVDEEPYRVGIISYSFTWTNFATVDGERIHVGDALQTSDGTLFRTLSSGQRLVIEPPSNYGFVDAPTSTEDGALVWDGPHEFGENGVQITILEGAGGPFFLPGAGWLIASVLALVILVGGIAYLLTRRDIDVGVPIPSDRLSVLENAELPGRSNSPADGHKTATADGNGGSDVVSTADSSASGDPESGTSLEFEESVDDEIDPELLSDEERVHRLLKQNGGRMKQASIVSETGWSNAKVSQLLSKMDDDDEIEKLRIGRENLITLPGVDPTEVE